MRERKRHPTGVMGTTRYPLWGKLKYRIVPKKRSRWQWLKDRARMNVYQQEVVDYLTSARTSRTLEQIWENLPDTLPGRRKVLLAVRSLVRKGYIIKVS